MSDPRTFLRGLFDAALAAVDPLACTPAHLPEAPKGLTVVVAFGKGAAAMAKAVEDHWGGPLSGLAVTRYGHGLDCRRIEVIEAGHPMPDAAWRWRPNSVPTTCSWPWSRAVGRRC